MIAWLIGLAAYLTVGLVFVFVGPAARLRRRDRTELWWHASDQPQWKLSTYSLAVATGIVVLWPVLVVSASRVEAASGAEFEPHARLPIEPSEEVDRRISEIQSRHPNRLSIEDYREIGSTLPWTDCGHFDTRLEQLGYGVTGFATDPQGLGLAVAVPVLTRIGVPFVLTEFRGRVDSALAQPKTSVDSNHRDFPFHVHSKADDEIWEFSTDSASWEHLAGRAGFAVVRERTVIDAYVTEMS